MMTTTVGHLRARMTEDSSPAEMVAGDLHTGGANPRIVCTTDQHHGTTPEAKHREPFRPATEQTNRITALHGWHVATGDVDARGANANIRRPAFKDVFPLNLAEAATHRFSSATTAALLLTITHF
ncbi:MAG TPA: hypothetical protein VF618_02305 [Thermoanaerobaculia bacterium]